MAPAAPKAAQSKKTAPAAAVKGKARAAEAKRPVSSKSTVSPKAVAGKPGKPVASKAAARKTKTGSAP
jgi:hypothetical protein